ncbi:MAG: hypothetical protein SP1CHLAM54_03440 [Chlamydiia bacterium]|nr:hypothetical protein [Chlamydiia bacterium]MCH9615260.1 hypothetical protein [Chlamydiia bacterium]MCH9628418.1 hypothetical protein [Chlamydiia bacterium]
MTDIPPDFLYKVLSTNEWKESQTQKTITLGSMDKEFIHLSKKEQLDRIVSKYWNKAPEYVLLKLDPKKLQGVLIFEANPGGQNMYYHLYEGSIPHDAIVEVQVCPN